jgi:hypothetical protein
MFFFIFIIEKIPIACIEKYGCDIRIFFPESYFFLLPKHTRIDLWKTNPWASITSSPDLIQIEAESLDLGGPVYLYYTKKKPIDYRCASMALMEGLNI